MYLDYFGLQDQPFRITPDTHLFFTGAQRGSTLEALLYTIMHGEGIVKITGEVGSGKTMLCRVLMERFPQHVKTIYLASPSYQRDEIHRALAEELGVDHTSDRISSLLRALQDRLITYFAKGRQVVIIIDEAHAMPEETLEEIRLLSNIESSRHKLLQITLFGQPELNEILTRPHMRQLGDRIAYSFHLQPLVRKEVSSYMDFRLRNCGYRGPDLFHPGAVRAITQYSRGFTRRINILADKSMLAAFAEGAHQVRRSHVLKATKDTDLPPTTARPKWRWLWGAAVLLVGALAAGGWYVLHSHQAAPGDAASLAHPASASSAKSALPAPAVPAADSPLAAPQASTTSSPAPAKSLTPAAPAVDSPLAAHQASTTSSPAPAKSFTSAAPAVDSLLVAPQASTTSSPAPAELLAPAAPAKNDPTTKAPVQWPLERAHP